MSIDDRKGGYGQVEWMDIYGRQFQALGWSPYEAECHALNAWEASPEDAEPFQTAADDIAYMASDC
jgi:hypothetical protein